MTVDRLILIGVSLLGTCSSYPRHQVSDNLAASPHYPCLAPAWRGVFTNESTLIATPDLELVGVSMGACYSYRCTYSPLYLNRLPASVSLENLETGDAVKYNPFQLFASRVNRFNPFSPFISKPLRLGQAIVRSRNHPKSLQLTIALPNGVVTNQAFIDKCLDERQIGSELKLVIDRYGVVWVRQESEQRKPRVVPIFDRPRWQTGGQKAALERLLEQQREYEDKMERRGLINVTRPPWDYPTP